MDAALVIEPSQPFRVRSASETFLKTFGYDEKHVLGRSVRFLHGPATAGQGIIGIVKAQVASEEPKSVPRTLVAAYGSDGGRRLVSVEAGRDLDGACVLRMEPAFVVSWNPALADDGTCKMVLSADKRRIEAVSVEFAAKYGFSLEAALGRTANLVHGPGSDPQRLRVMMDAAASGIQQCSKILTFSSDCSAIPATVTVTGIYDGEVGRVSHFLVRFVADFPRVPSANLHKGLSSKGRFSPLRPPSVVTPARLSERYDIFIKATLLFLVLPTFLHLGGPSMASGSTLAGIGAALYHGAHPTSRAFDARTPQSLPPLRKSESALTCRVQNHAHKRIDVPSDACPVDDKVTLVLDLDKTVLYGNDGNDLGVALQWMDKDQSIVQELYAKLISPNLRKAYNSYLESGRKVDVVIYTRRPQIVYYKSCVRQNTVPVRYADDWHAQGQLFLPPGIQTSQDIFSTYAGPDLLEDEQHDVKMSLDRLLAARDAVVRELGLPQAPPVVVTSQAKDLETTARHLGVPIETCLLFDDNTDLRHNPRVVLVEPLDSLAPPRRRDVLAFMQRHAPIDTLDPDLVDYLEEARPDEKSVRRGADGRLSWWIPEAAHALPCWRTPPPSLQRQSRLRKPLPRSTVTVTRKGLLNNAPPLKTRAKGLELRMPFSNVSPADVPARSGQHGLVDLRAAAEKAARMRGLDCEAGELDNTSR